MAAITRRQCLLAFLLAIYVLLCAGLRVRNLKELNRDSTSITIEWTIATSDFTSAENKWVGFKIKYYAEKVQYTPIMLGNVQLRRFRLDNLKSNTEYKIQVSAYDNMDNEGPASNLLAVKTFEAVPGEPQDFKVNRVTSHSIELEWKAPRRGDDSASASIKGYEIHYFKVNPASLSQQQDGGGAGSETPVFKRKTNDMRKLKYTLVDLEPSSLYKIQIFAYNIKGDGQRSSPLLVSTLDDGPTKPEKIRSEIQDEMLYIKWQPPNITHSQRQQKLAGYRLYFNNEKYDVDEHTTQITFQRPKWDYDRQYDFRIAAKVDEASGSVPVYGQEAVYRISTHTNQSKIVINLDKLTSTSVLIKWNNVTFSHSPRAHRRFYQLEYWPRNDAQRVVPFKGLTNTELRLTGLQANHEYIVQIMAYLADDDDATNDKSMLLTSEVALKAFRTLASDMPAPANFQVIRYEPKKANLKWDPVVIPSSGSQRFNLIKGYRVYYKALDSGYGEDYAQTSESKIEILGERNTELNIDTLDPRRDYIIKVLAIDHENNEGPESQVQYANRLLGNGDDSLDVSPPPSIIASSSDVSNLPLSDKIGVPRDLTVMELSSTAVKFGWLPPTYMPGSLPINLFRLSYTDRLKYYKEANGTLVSFSSGVTMSVKVPVRDDPSIRITWLVNSLAPNTVYDFNLSAVAEGSQRQGASIYRTVHTKRDRPASVNKPVVLDIYSDNTVLIATGNASERNGPIAKYCLVVTPMGYADPTVVAVTQAQQLQHYETRERDISALLRYSIFNATHPSLYANESTYIAAEFEAAHWPEKFILGDGNIYGRFFNRKLIRGYDYKAYILAFTESSPLDANFKSQSPIGMNMLVLSDILQQKSNSEHKATAASAGQLGSESSDLYSTSQYSDIFNTRSHDLHHLNGLYALTNVGAGDYRNIAWIGGAIGCFIFLLICVILVSLHVMRRKKRKEAHGARHMTQLSATTGGTGASASMLANAGSGMRHHGGHSMSTTMTTNDQFMLTADEKFETIASLSHDKTGLIQTSTLTKTATQQRNRSIVSEGGVSKQSKGVINQSQSAHKQQGVITSSASNSTASSATASSSSSSSSSSSHASPTTALLSCSVTDSAHNEQQPMPTATGLLTAASPLRLNESLYTSIEASAQKLLQQQQLANTNPYDNNNQMMMMMMMNNANSFNSAGSVATLTRQQTQQQQVATMSPSSALIQLMSGGGNMAGSTPIISTNYDPIEFRRIQYQTAGMQAHQPIAIDDLPLHVERLKAQNNAKFSLEYESIEPGQQFQWEHSTLDLNRQKNRYANVIAYDHSRVVLSRLPVQCFQPLASQQATLGASAAATAQSIYGSHSHFGTNQQPQPSSQLYGAHNNYGINCNEPDPLSHVLSNNPSSATSTPAHLLQQHPPHSSSTTSLNVAALASCSDYINANFMDGYRKRNCYIATQAPLPSTFGDFWRMIWEQQSCSIVMVTKLEERNRLKCDQYWPMKGTECYADVMQVTLVDQTELAFYVVRTFVIGPVGIYAQMQLETNSHNENYEMRREVKQYQFTGWPDHGCSEHPAQFLMFMRHVKRGQVPDSGPVVVHCSAGVGRTGCYIVIDSMIERLRHEQTVDIYGHVTCLRAQRNYIVQTEDQYIFCYDAVLESWQAGQTEVTATNLYQHLQGLLQISTEDASCTLTEMELEYGRLSNIKAPQSKFQTANLPANKFKNRLVNILPYESTRVCLSMLPNDTTGALGTDYINANFIDGYRTRRAYIATQAPLPETCDDFWRMLWEHNSTIIVMLTKLREMGREKCAQYWPAERSMRYQYFVVDPVAEYDMSHYVLREFKVTDARDGHSRTVRQFQFVDWPEQGVPKSGESIVDLIGQVHKTKEQFGQTGPITVHCSAGVGRTGVFMTLSIVLERMRAEGVVDVFNTVKLTRLQRPAMVQTEDQYQFCYRAALEYLGSFGNYD